MAVEQSPATIVITDTHGAIQYVNSKFTQVTGYSYEEAIGNNPRILKSGYTSQEEYDTMWETISKGKEWRGEFMNLKKNGETYWELASISPILNAKGEIISYLAIKEDITQRKLIEKELLESEQKYRGIFRISPFPMWFMREGDLKYIDVNEAAIAAYGYSREEYLNMTAFQLRPDHELNRFSIATKNFHNGYQGVWTHRKKNGELIQVEIYIQKMVHLGVPCFVSLAIDITEKLKAEKELNNAYEELRRLAAHLQDIREEERSTIAREIHDDLGQQLAGLKMSISMVDRKISNEDEIIKERIRNVVALTDSTIQSARRISARLHPTILDTLGLTDALRWLCEEFGKNSPAKILFYTNMDKEEIPANTSLAIYRICQESLTNISRYAKADTVSVSLELEDDKVKLEIKDDGCGFDPEKIKTRRSLGLVNMKERTIMMNGELNINSSPGNGTEIIVTIPHIKHLN